MSSSRNTNSNKRQPSRAARQRVEDAFDPAALKDICERLEIDFGDYAQFFDLGQGDFYYHADNGADILAVGHLDTVQQDRTCQITETASGLLATSGGLDDRLGVYVILDLLPKLDVQVDWLLTTNEEQGASTAAEFTTEKNYNWIIEFDRGGTDVVMYQYEEPYLVDLVEACGARVGQGIFSDISVLDHLGCAAFNWGVGYQDYHSARSHAWLDDTFRMVARFVKFYKANKDLRFTYEEDDWSFYRGRLGGGGWGHVDSADDDEYRDEYASWWENSSKMAADCGHLVDVDDPETYVEYEGRIYCSGCMAL